MDLFLERICQFFLILAKNQREIDEYEDLEIDHNEEINIFNKFHVISHQIGSTCKYAHTFNG